MQCSELPEGWPSLHRWGLLIPVLVLFELFSGIHLCKPEGSVKATGEKDLVHYSTSNRRHGILQIIEISFASYFAQSLQALYSPRLHSLEVHHQSPPIALLYRQLLDKVRNSI